MAFPKKSFFFIFFFNHPHPSLLWRKMYKKKGTHSAIGNRDKQLSWGLKGLLVKVESSQLQNLNKEDTELGCRALYLSSSPVANSQCSCSLCRMGSCVGLHKINGFRTISVKISVLSPLQFEMKKKTDCSPQIIDITETKCWKTFIKHEKVLACQPGFQCRTHQRLFI